MGKHVFCPWQLVWVKKPSPASYASNIQHKGNAQITSTVNPVCSEGTHRPLMWSEAVFRACYKKNNLSFSTQLPCFLSCWRTMTIQKKIKHRSHTCTHRQTLSFQQEQHAYNTSSTAQGGGGNFNSSKPIRETSCCDSRMAQQKHWWMELSKWLTDWLTTWRTD